MNKRESPQYFIAALLIFLVLVALTATIFYTFSVGTVTPTPTPTVNLTPTSSLTPAPEPARLYPDQAKITDSLVVLGIIIVAVILFGVAWGRRMSLRRLPKSGGK